MNYQTNYPQEPHVQVKRRRPISFAWRLTFGQFWRMLGLFLSMDVLIVLLYSALTLVELDHTAARLFALPQEEAVGAAIAMEDTEVWTGNWKFFNANLHPRVEERFGLVPEADRDVVFYHTYSYRWILRDLGIRYDIGIENPAEGSPYRIVSFDLTWKMIRFYNAMKVLLVVELLMLFSQTIATRRAVRRTLAPIQQLAMATWDISAGGTDAVKEKPQATPKVNPKAAEKAKKREEREKQRQRPNIELSGTIRALNQINAKHLDTRIPIDEERAELRGLAIAINGMLDRLDAAYSSQVRFVSDASHELRTPIAVIQGYANLLDRWGKEDPEALEESIAAIKAEAEGMKELVEQLLFLARSDNDTIAMEVESIDASALTKEVLRNTQVIDKEHVFTADIEPGCFIEGDDVLIKQALRILTDNAVKYTPSGESIRLAVKREGDWVKLSVTDNGIGIPEEDLPHVVERFFRSDESRARATGGTGLGLSIASWIIRRHDGHLEILSRRDIGTRMTIKLPAAEIKPLDCGEDQPLAL
jgi:signal transduction histidine kinase